ncbi:MAG TPA: hypothetical protein VFV53_00315 [Candidatus Limnocylindrales bacterium]|nr:hypothetical protein [Candidatus Limnocylindrales bacterium]
MDRPTGPGFAAIAVLAGIAIASACGGALAPTARPSLAPAPTATPPATDRPSTPAPSIPQPSTGTAFGDAWAAAVAAHDLGATEVMIANPLSEWDLVGVRLIDLVGRTRAELAALEAPAELQPETLGLDEGIGATLTLLEAIDPHGSVTDQAEAFLLALDEWVADVRPRAEAIREALGLPPVPPGDLRL